jgi:hypothetical protein
MLFISWMGLKILGCDTFNGVTQRWVRPIIVASKVKGACIKVAQTLIISLQRLGGHECDGNGLSPILVE